MSQSTHCTHTSDWHKEGKPCMVCGDDSSPINQPTLSPAIKSGDELAIEALGRRATDCELEAASYGEHSWERRMLLERAAQYREQQAEVLEMLPDRGPLCASC